MRILLLGFAFLTLANCDPVQNLHYQDYVNSINPVDFYKAPGASPLGSSFIPIENDGKYRNYTKSFLLGILLLLFIKLLRKLFEILYVFKMQKRIVSAETIRGNQVHLLYLGSSFTPIENDGKYHISTKRFLL